MAASGGGSGGARRGGGTGGFGGAGFQDPNAPTPAEIATLNKALLALLSKDSPEAKAIIDAHPMWAGPLTAGGFGGNAARGGGSCRRGGGGGAGGGGAGG
jgi:hypothetical protein